MTSPHVEAVRTALEVALLDFQHPTPVVLRLEVDQGDGEDLVWVSSPGCRTGFWAGDAAPGAEVLVQVADFLQDQVFDQLAQTWGQARPPCPGHPHAPDAVLLDEQAWWRCPRTRQRLALVGSLRDPDTSR